MMVLVITGREHSLQAMISVVSSASCRGVSGGGDSPLYDRIISSRSASTTMSSSSSSACNSMSSVPPACYPLNPPPSPCTSAAYSQRRHDFTMTPCSTDVCDDVDSASALCELCQCYWHHVSGTAAPSSHKFWTVGTFSY